MRASDAMASDASKDAFAPGPAPGGTAIWVYDAADVPVGVMFRRGGDDSVAGRAVYDLVTVFHPQSGIFFEITMSDGQVRYPVNVFFRGPYCAEPVGASAGGCAECRSGFGLGFLHGNRWWRIRGGEIYQQVDSGSVRETGLSERCVAHGTSSAKAFPLDEVLVSPPPTVFEGPLRFVWR